MHENFFHKLKVYYEDTDSGGVVYYANYLKFLERARTEALFSIGYSNKKTQEMFNSLIIVKSCSIEYKKSAYLEDQLKVRSFVKSISKTSFFMNQIITKEEDVIVDEEVVEPPITTSKKVKTSMGVWNMLGVVSLGVLLYGLSRAGKEQ